MIRKLLEADSCWRKQVCYDMEASFRISTGHPS